MTRTRYGRPAMTCQTPWSMPAARTRRSTSSAPTTGFSISLSSRTSDGAVRVLHDRLHDVGEMF